MLELLKQLCGCSREIYAFASAHEGMVSLLAIALILHLPEDLPRLESFTLRQIIRYAGAWNRWLYAWLRDSLQAYVNRPAKKQ